VSTTSRRRRTEGSALLITVLLLLLLGALGFAAMNAATRDQQVAGFQNRRKIAFYAAEAGVARALEALTNSQTPAVPTANLGDTTVFPHGQPGYREDPTAADAIEPLGTGAFPGMSLNIGQGGTATYMLSFWKIRVQGEGPGGSVARLETVAGALSTN
jgi:hypothetical protein